MIILTYFLEYKTIETYAREFLSLIIKAVGSVLPADLLRIVPLLWQIFYTILLEIVSNYIGMYLEVFVLILLD